MVGRLLTGLLRLTRWVVLDPPGNSLANRAMVKLGEPITCSVYFYKLQKHTQLTKTWEETWDERELHLDHSWDSAIKAWGNMWHTFPFFQVWKNNLCLDCHRHHSSVPLAEIFCTTVFHRYQNNVSNRQNYSDSSRNEKLLHKSLVKQDGPKQVKCIFQVETNWFILATTTRTHLRRTVFKRSSYLLDVWKAVSLGVVSSRFHTSYKKM